LELAALGSRPSVAAGRLLLEKLPFLLAAFVTGLITLHGGSRVSSLPSVAACPIPARLANVTLSYARYCWQVFWPVKLAVFYPFPAAFSVWSVAGAGLLLVAMSVAAICLARRWPYVMVGWLWYLITLLPVIGLIQLGSYSHADRYTYVPLIGVFVLLVWGGYDLARRWRYGVMAMLVAGSGRGVDGGGRNFRISEPFVPWTPSLVEQWVAHLVHAGRRRIRGMPEDLLATHRAG
jgi:hypothetical protein